MSLPFPIVERKAWGLNSDLFFVVVIFFATGATLTAGAVTTIKFAGRDASLLVSNAHNEESTNSFWGVVHNVSDSALLGDYAGIMECSTFRVPGRTKKDDHRREFHPDHQTDYCRQPSVNRSILHMPDVNSKQ
jgi:hypothetical protein